MYNIKKQFISKNSNSRLYQIDVPIIGLTGGISTGKSTVAEILRSKNLPIIDADRLVKTVYQRNEVVSFIKEHFSDALINNQIDFKILRKIAFSDKSNIEKIEKLIYQYLPETFLLEFKKLNNPSFIIYDVPLLFEKGLDKLVDVKVCVYATRAKQIERLTSRDSISKDEAAKILDFQLNIEDKKNQSDFIINNNSNREDLKHEVENFLNNILDDEKI